MSSDRQWAQDRANCSPLLRSFDWHLLAANRAESTHRRCGAGIMRVIARRGASHGSGLGKVRWVVERTIAWLHQYERLAIRWEYRAEIH